VIVIPAALLGVFAALVVAHHVTQPGIYTAPAPGTPVHATAAQGRYVGVYEPGSPGSYAPVRAFEATSGVRPNLALYYSSWWEPFRLQFAKAAYTNGAMPFVQMIPHGRGVSVDRVAQGQYDGYLRTFAEQVRRYGHPVVLGFAAEANGSWYNWGFKHLSPKVWIAAWRHVVTVFREQGADNVTWLWTINRSGKRTGPVRDWWPGSTYVNWIGIDGYLEEPPSTFSGVFAPTIAQVRQFSNDPILLAETAVGPLADPAGKIPGMFDGIRADHLLGLVWFDKAQHNGVYHQDWRLEDDPPALAVFRKAANNFK